MKPDNDLSVLAGKLTFVEQTFLRSGHVRVSWPFEAKARDRLVARGLLEKRWFSYRWTPLGLALRNHLLDEDSRHG